MTAGLDPDVYQAITAGFSALAAVAVAFNNWQTIRNRRQIERLHTCLDEHHAENRATIAANTASLEKIEEQTK